MPKQRELKHAESTFLASQRKTGMTKKIIRRKGIPGRPTKDFVIQRALKEQSKDFFKRILDDKTEEKLWKMFISGKAEQLDERGFVVKDDQGRPFMVDIELNAISWNAFKQMVAYKHGMPSIRVESNDEKQVMNVNFNIMGVSPEKMQQRVKELGLLPVSASSEV